MASSINSLATACFLTFPMLLCSLFLLTENSQLWLEMLPVSQQLEIFPEQCFSNFEELRITDTFLWYQSAQSAFIA